MYKVIKYLISWFLLTGIISVVVWTISAVVNIECDFRSLFQFVFWTLFGLDLVVTLLKPRKLTDDFNWFD